MENQKKSSKISVIIGIVCLICVILSAVFILYLSQKSDIIEKQVSHDILEGVPSETELGFESQTITIAS